MPEKTLDLLVVLLPIFTVDFYDFLLYRPQSPVFDFLRGTHWFDIITFFFALLPCTVLVVSLDASPTIVFIVRDWN